MEGRCPLPFPGDRHSLARAPNTNAKPGRKCCTPDVAAYTARAGRVNVIRALSGGKKGGFACCQAAACGWPVAVGFQHPVR